MKKQQHMENCSLADVTGVMQAQNKGIFFAFEYFSQTTGLYYPEIPSLKSKAVLCIHIREKC